MPRMVILQPISVIVKWDFLKVPLCISYYTRVWEEPILTALFPEKSDSSPENGDNNSDFSDNCSDNGDSLSEFGDSLSNYL